MFDFDFDSYYTVEGYSGVAWVATGHTTNWIDDGYWEDCEDYDCDHDHWIDDIYEETDYGWVVCHMVGDDREFEFEISELTKLEEDVCSCGQVGCGWA